MKSALFQFSIFIFLIGSLTACNSSSVDDVELTTASATNTKEATAIPTITERPTSAATSTLMAYEIRSGDSVRVTPWMTFKIPLGYLAELSSPAAFINNANEEMPMIVAVFEQGSGGADEATAFINRFAENVGGVDFGEESVITLGEDEFTVQDVHWIVESIDVYGQYAHINFKNGSQFVGLAFATAEEDSTLWEKEGIAAFHFVLESILFGQGTRQGTACAVSRDGSYGYSQSNPIKIGGSDLSETPFNGPAKERAYLDSLLAPNGEPIRYERIGSFPGEDTILDGYSIQSDGFSGERVLYIDIYNSAPVFAAAQFICGGAFPFSPE